MGLRQMFPVQTMRNVPNIRAFSGETVRGACTPAGSVRREPALLPAPYAPLRSGSTAASLSPAAPPIRATAPAM